VLAGVCGGAARWLGWNVTVVRVAVVALALVTSVVPVVLAYGLLALIVPEDRSRRRALEWWDEEREREDWLAS
jgi:phage shock protein PspC (stress-responsive transcriptional regulator)